MAMLPASDSSSLASSSPSAADCDADVNSRAPAALPSTDSLQTSIKQQQDIHNDENTTVPTTAAIPRSNSVHKQIQPPRYVRSNPIGLQRANTLSSPVKQQQQTSIHTTSPAAARAPLRARRTSAPHPDEGAFPPRSASVLGLSTGSAAQFTTNASTSPVKVHFSRSTSGLPDRKLQSLLFKYGDTSQVSDLPSDPKTWTPSQLSIYVSL